MKHLGLFAGIGGFELAAKWMGWQTVAWCEWNPFCQRVLKYYFPEAEGFGDITKTDFTKFYGTIDILTAGFPCQPASLAGNRKGTEDDRWQWPQTLRAIKEIRPGVAILENVAGLFSILESASLTEVESKEIKLFCESENYQVSETILRIQRRVIGTIIEDLKQAGYVLPQLEDGTPVVCCIPACGVNAPHRRDRVWFVAYAESIGRGQRNRKTTFCNRWQGAEYFTKGAEVRNWHQTVSRTGVFAYAHNGHELSLCRENPYQWRKYPEYPFVGNIGGNGDTTYSNGTGRKECHFSGITTESRFSCGECNENACYPQRPGFQRGVRTKESKRPEQGHSRTDWTNWPTQSPICDGDDGFSTRLVDITFSKWRTESIKGGGNAIVPQVAYQIYQVIDKIQNT